MAPHGTVRSVPRASGVWLLLICFAFTCAASDWPQFRGRNHDGISTDHIITNWSGTVGIPIWRAQLTNALCSLVVSDGKVYTQTIRTIDGFLKDVCVALSATNGVELWATPLENTDYPQGGVGYDDGPRSTPAVADGGVFVLTSYLKLYRLDPASGTVVWMIDFPTVYGAVVIPWQNAASPLIANGVIYLNANVADGEGSLMALRTSDGSVVWRSQNENMTHSTPVLATIHGVPQVIFATQQGVLSVNASDGNFLWRIDYPFIYGTSVAASPVVWSNIVFAVGGRAYGMGSVAYQVNYTNTVWFAVRLWYSQSTAAHWMSPIAYNGYLFGHFGIFQFDGPEAQLTCMDIRTGAVKWQRQGFGRAGTVMVGDKLVSLTERGDLVLSKVDTNAYTELGRFQAIPNYFSDTNKCWNGPAISDGKIFARSSAFVAAFDLSVPALKLEPPRFVAADKLALTIGASGASILSNRAAAMEVLATTNPAQAFPQWIKLTNGLTLTNGRVRVDNVNASDPRRYFIVREPN